MCGPPVASDRKADFRRLLTPGAYVVSAARPEATLNSDKVQTCTTANLANSLFQACTGQLLLRLSPCQAYGTEEQQLHPVFRVAMSSRFFD